MPLVVGLAFLIGGAVLIARRRVGRRARVSSPQDEDT
ncbi:hypothetical protein DMH04_18250 [Kibdelosporangium aridum]|uniref:LPXTG cell wall anchor domain-containing protein n=1 Tax=Kibdelosporangium aridum TaxID=2030 RepID=A0A428ZAY5_KIBAR|nr:hypothetical protein DMH04_18250 [Kibdelosporangium aridum]